MQYLFEMLPLEDINPEELIPFMPDQEQIFAYVACEYISLKQPGKALIILKEGLRTRQLLSKRLNDLALKAEKITST